MELPTWITQYWIQWIFGLIATGFVSLFAWIRKRLKAVNNGVKALLRDRIIQAYNYQQDKECCPIYALENILSMHTEYKALGGNGATDRLVEELKQMPREKK